ncbi:MAG: glycosyl hydrolase family 79 C-terminal domain-containing protein [Myxococcaceae bacterium]
MGNDAGQPDSGVADASVSDAGERTDAGTDAGLDAGLDAGVDAGFDAGFDAGTTDAGGGDAGDGDGGIDAGFDGGEADAGPVDAGFDAGTLPFDAGTIDAVVTIDVANPGAAVPSDFLGLSVEWSHVNDVLGDTTGHPRATVVQLLQNFAADGHTLVLRIGGNSEDQAYWNPSGGALPSGATVSLDASQLGVLSELSTATGAHYVLGLNLARNDSANAAALVTAALAALPAGSIDAFEVGNEPDLYALTGARPFYYSQYLFQPDFDGYFPALSTAASNQPLFAAPAVYGTTWFSWLSGFLSAESGRLSLVTVHHYPYEVCSGLNTPTLASLFTAQATTDFATTFAPVVQTCSAAGLKLRVAEMNSISCGGVPGVSDVFAAGLWGADAMFELASVGAAGVNVHGPGKYPVFDFDSTGALEVRGLYYGMLLFSHATAQQGRWLNATVSSSHQVRAWSTIGSDGVTRAAVINEDLASAVRVAITVPMHAGAAQAYALTAVALDSTTQISFGAQTWSGSTDGLPSGALSPVSPPSNGDTWYVDLPAGSAAFFTAP